MAIGDIIRKGGIEAAKKAVKKTQQIGAAAKQKDYKQVEKLTGRKQSSQKLREDLPRKVRSSISKSPIKKTDTITQVAQKLAAQEILRQRNLLEKQLRQEQNRERQERLIEQQRQREKEIIRSANAALRNEPKTPRDIAFRERLREEGFGYGTERTPKEGIVIDVTKKGPQLVSTGGIPLSVDPIMLKEQAEQELQQSLPSGTRLFIPEPTSVRSSMERPEVLETIRKERLVEEQNKLSVAAKTERERLQKIIKEQKGLSQTSKGALIALTQVPRVQERFKEQKQELKQFGQKTLDIVSQGTSAGLQLVGAGIKQTGQRLRAETELASYGVKSTIATRGKGSLFTSEKESELRKVIATAEGPEAKLLQTTALMTAASLSPVGLIRLGAAGLETVYAVKAVSAVVKEPTPLRVVGAGVVSALALYGVGSEGVRLFKSGKRLFSPTRVQETTDFFDVTKTVRVSKTGKSTTERLGRGALVVEEGVVEGKKFSRQILALEDAGDVKLSGFEKVGRQITYVDTSSEGVVLTRQRQKLFGRGLTDPETVVVGKEVLGDVFGKGRGVGGRVDFGKPTVLLQSEGLTPVLKTRARGESVSDLIIKQDDFVTKARQKLSSEVVDLTKVTSPTRVVGFETSLSDVTALKGYGRTRLLLGARESPQVLGGVAELSVRELDNLLGAGVDGVKVSRKIPSLIESSAVKTRVGIRPSTRVKESVVFSRGTRVSLSRKKMLFDKVKERFGIRPSTQGVRLSTQVKESVVFKTLFDKVKERFGVRPSTQVKESFASQVFRLKTELKKSALFSDNVVGQKSVSVQKMKTPLIEKVGVTTTKQAQVTPPNIPRIKDLLPEKKSQGVGVLLGEEKLETGLNVNLLRQQQNGQTEKLNVEVQPLLVEKERVSLLSEEITQLKQNEKVKTRTDVFSDATTKTKTRTRSIQDVNTRTDTLTTTKQLLKNRTPQTTTTNLTRSGQGKGLFDTPQGGRKVRFPQFSSGSTRKKKKTTDLYEKKKKKRKTGLIADLLTVNIFEAKTGTEFVQTPSSVRTRIRLRDEIKKHPLTMFKREKNLFKKQKKKGGLL